MRLARWLCIAAVPAALVALPSTAAAKLEFNLPAQIFKVFDESGRTDADPERCAVSVFVEFPKIRHAKGYRIVVFRSDLNDREDFVAPPFDLYGRGFILRYPAPRGFARFFIGAYSTGDGCAVADATTEVAEIESAKVSLDRYFQKRFRRTQKPPLTCSYEPGERTVRLGRRGDGRKVIVRRQGQVTITQKGSKQPVNVATNTYALSGTIVKTGRNSVVSIGSLDGPSVLVAPNTTVRITDAGLEVVEAPRHPRPWELNRAGDDYKVRTDCAVLSSRG
jgi:hypothetical protein